MNRRQKFERKQAAFKAGAVQVTLDPEGPGVARLHLIPPVPSLDSDPPHVLIVNGWHVIPVGESWAWLLRTFMNELPKVSKPGTELTDEQISAVEERVVRKMSSLYPGIKASVLRNDLRTIVDICIKIARGEETGIQANMSLRDYATNMAAPHRMDLIVSPMSLNDHWLCPLNCGNCYAKGQPTMNISRELTPLQWYEIIQKCKKAGIPQLTFTGGEPTMLPYLHELIEEAKWFITRLNTSGVTMTTGLAQKLRSASLDGIQMTLYSHIPAIHDGLVGKAGSWERTVRGVKIALNAGLGLSVNTPLIKLNSDYVETLTFLKGLGVTQFGCSGLIPTGGATGTIDRGGALSNIELFTLMQATMAYADEQQLDVMFTSPGWLKPEQLQALGLPDPICGACLSNMAVTPSGLVVPCQSWLGDPKGLGNMLTDEWSTIWNSAKCKQMRNTQQTGCPLENL